MGQGSTPFLDPPDPLGSVRKTNEKNTTKEGGVKMSKIIDLLQKVIGKAGHKYTGLTVKTPFMNFSFVPASVQKPTV